MITSLPAVQLRCKRVRKYVRFGSDVKKTANRRHRRALNAITREIERDIDAFDDETFEAPSLSSWDLY